MSEKSIAAELLAALVEAAGRGNLEKIRDILFGAQVQDFEKRVARLEEKLLKRPRTPGRTQGSPG